MGEATPPSTQTSDDPAFMSFTAGQNSDLAKEVKYTLLYRDPEQVIEALVTAIESERLNDQNKLRVILEVLES
ncbi:hypothetical protein PQX77_019533, partial [Marasmius sp. AFHP31]